MCCRFFVDGTSELHFYAEKAKDSPLAALMVNKLIRPIICDGEVAPTNIVPVLASSKAQTATVFPMVWGIPNPRGGSPLINCRAETAGQKPFWKEAWRAHRCVIPASFYFEWEHRINQSTGKKETGDKYLIQPKNSAVTWLAGVYRIEEMSGIRVPVFAVLTREPGEGIRFIHDRMPLILPERLTEDWIRPDTQPDELMKNALTDMVFEKAV